MSLQTSVSSVMSAAFVGQLYDLTDSEGLGRTAEGSAIAFGIAVVQGTHDNQCRVPDHGDVLGLGATTDADNVFLGVSIYEARKFNTVLTLPLGEQHGYIEQTDTVSINRHARIWVRPETAVAPNAPVFFRHTLTDPAADPQTEQLGAFRVDDDGGNANEVAGARFLYTSAAGELNVLDLSALR